MRVVADTNVVLSGLLWRGPPRSILDAAREGTLQLFTTSVLLAELEEVLNRPKFTQRLEQAQTTPLELVLGYAALATVVPPALIPPSVLADADDDAVLACAVGAQADTIVSGDDHLLDLQAYANIRIVSPAEMLAQF